jgi:hypothetical protein
LVAELLGQFSFEPQCGLIVELIVITGKTQLCAEVVLWQPLHADQEAALSVETARPFFDEVIDCLPTAEVEVANAEVRTVGANERFAECRQKTKFYVVENAWHSAPPTCLTALLWTA